MLKKVAKSKIARNTFFLYILTLSNYFLGFLLIPYEARVLGPEVFGLVGFAMAFALAFQVIVDFGFMVSATELISRHRDKSRHVANIVSSTMLAKLYLSALAALLFVVSALLIPMVRDNSLICFLFFANGVLTAMMPDFFYRGIEKMKTITIRTVFVRGVGVALVLLFVKAPEHATLIPLFFILSSLIALIAVFYDITRNHKVKLSYAKPKDVVSSIQKSAWFFFSRIAVNVNSSMSSFFLGIQYAPASMQMGLYTGARNLTQAAEMMITPVTDSIYPHMIKERNYHLLKKVLVFGSIAMLLGCIVAAIFAEPFSILLLGEEYRQAGGYLQILLIGVLFAYPNMLLGFPALSPIGLSKHANIANIISAVCIVVALSTLWLTSSISVLSVCVVVSSANIIMLMYRLAVLLKNRHLIKELSDRAQSKQ